MARLNYERIKTINAIRAGWREAFGRSYEDNHDGNPHSFDVDTIAEEKLRIHYIETKGGETPPRGCSKARWTMYRKLRAEPERYAWGGERMRLTIRISTAGDHSGKCHDPREVSSNG